MDRKKKYIYENKRRKEKEKMKEQITSKRIFAFVIASILPILVIAWGIFMLFRDTLFNITFFITYVAIPIPSIAIIALLIFSKRGIWAKIIHTLFILFLFVMSFFISNLFGTFEMLTHKIDGEISESYNDVCKAFGSMPLLDELGNYTTAEHYDYFSSTFLIFTCDADTLIVYYNEAEYQEQKALLDTKYVFQETEMIEHERACTPYAEISGYSFRTLSIDQKNGEEINYPQKLVFIATNDMEHSIAYTAFYDDDIDYIESLAEFLLKNCGWKHII